MMSLGSRSCKRIVFQVADVHKPLLSISGCADMGSDCYFGSKGVYLLDKHSGEKIFLKRRDNLMSCGLGYDNTWELMSVSLLSGRASTRATCY